MMGTLQQTARQFSKLVCTLALIFIAWPWPVWGQTTTYSLLYSTSSSRANPVSLAGQTVSGNIYVFTSPDTGVSQVDFFLGNQSTPFRTEKVAPYDFAGMAADGTAYPYNTTQLANGSHTITAKVTTTTGGSQTINAAFTVSNAAASFPFSDNFSDGNANGWTVVNQGQFASSWRVVGGAYQQSVMTGDVGTSLVGTYHWGTYSFLGAGAGWTDYRLQLTITPLPINTGEDVGVMFRYQDGNNYYRLSLNGRMSFARLEKRVNGNFSTLAVNARGYTVGQPLTVAIEVQGPSIEVFVNNDPLFSVSDASLASGSIALYCQNAASFDDISVTGNSSTPSVVISGPIAYSVDPGSTLDVSATASNVPAGGFVEFLLDGVGSQTAQIPPYTALFSSVSQGNHNVQAILHNSANGTLASDSNVQVGMQGGLFHHPGRQHHSWEIRQQVLRQQLTRRKDNLQPGIPGNPLRPSRRRASCHIVQ